MNKMEFISMRDFRTKTTLVWEKLINNEEIVITSNGRPRAFLVNIPDGYFDEMLTGIREAKNQIKPRIQITRQQFDLERTSEEIKASWQELRNMLSAIDGSSIDLKQSRAERRAAKYERND